MKNLLVVEDNKTVRQGLADLFKKNKEFGVSGTYGDLQAALADSRALHPDLIVLDLKLPDVRGTVAISKKKKSNSRLPYLEQTIKTYYTFVDQFPKSRYAKEAERIFNNSTELIKKLKANG